MDYAALKSEIVTNPRGYPYATPYAAGADADVAAVLNLVRTGAGGFAAITVNRPTVAAWELVNCVVASEWTALTQAARDGFALIVTAASSTGVPTTVAKAAGLRTLLGAIFPNGATRTALLALVDRQGSRAEELFGAGVTVTASDIAAARRA